MTVLTSGWRQSTIDQLDQRWDIVVVGGGITGAGIAREAARLGMSVLLLEKGDFASGSSSRSSKMVHGGLRYLAEKEINLVRISVRERQRLLREGEGLIEPLPFVITDYAFQEFSRRQFKWGLRVYDLMARARTSRYLDKDHTLSTAPQLLRGGLRGAFTYLDAGTDDSRLVMRVLQEAVGDGASVLNYMSAEEPLVGADQKVYGLKVRDSLTGEHHEINSRLVINATGAWSDHLRTAVGAEEQMRPLRGSHLTLPRERLPIDQAITFFHPQDNRPVFARSWEGTTMIGTTDTDHGKDMSFEPHATAKEVTYLLEAIAFFFPESEITGDDIIASWAGVRPIVGSGEEDPTKESRDHVVEFDQGMLTVTGGKLTTFRHIAADALNTAREVLPEMPVVKEKRERILNAIKIDPPPKLALSPAMVRRLYGRHGANADRLLNMVVDEKREAELEKIEGTLVLWCEVRWAARAEGVMQLQDLLLRRCRLGFLLANGGLDHEERIGEICREELGWNSTRWQQEVLAYRSQWRRHYGSPAVLAEEWPKEWAEVAPTAADQPLPITG